MLRSRPGESVPWSLMVALRSVLWRNTALPPLQPSMATLYGVALKTLSSMNTAFSVPAYSESAHEPSPFAWRFQFGWNMYMPKCQPSRSKVLWSMTPNVDPPVDIPFPTSTIKCTWSIRQVCEYPSMEIMAGLYTEGSRLGYTELLKVMAVTRVSPPSFVAMSSMVPLGLPDAGVGILSMMIVLSAPTPRIVSALVFHAGGFHAVSVPTLTVVVHVQVPFGIATVSPSCAALIAACTSADEQLVAVTVAASDRSHSHAGKSTTAITGIMVDVKRFMVSSLVKVPERMACRGTGKRHYISDNIRFFRESVNLDKTAVPVPHHWIGLSLLCRLVATRASSAQYRIYQVRKVLTPQAGASYLTHTLHALFPRPPANHSPGRYSAKDSFP